MVKLSFPLLACVKLTYLLAEVPGSNEDLDVWDEVSRKIELSQEDKIAIELEEADRRGAISVIWNPRADALKGNREVELETDHAKRLLNLMRSWPQFRRMDLEWTRPTIKALKEAVG
jgi:hypothetical protein